MDMRKARPDLVADIYLYGPTEGGKTLPIISGWHCACKTTLNDGDAAWLGWPILGDEILEPGDRGRFGWMFFSGKEAADLMKTAGKFYLWEDRVIGEATVSPNL